VLARIGVDRGSGVPDSTPAAFCVYFGPGAGVKI